MARILILILLSLSAKAQSGRYHIERADVTPTEGTVLITDHFIKINQDSSEITLPVIDTGKDKHTVYYILEGCYEGKGFRGYGMLTEGSRLNLGATHTRHYSSLFIELRMKREYISTNYSIYYDK